MTEPDNDRLKNDRLKNDRLKNDRLKDDRLSRSNISGLLAGLAVQPLVAAVLAFVVFPIVDYSQGPLRGRRPTVSMRRSLLLLEQRLSRLP